MKAWVNGKLLPVERSVDAVAKDLVVVPAMEFREGVAVALCPGH